MLPLFEGETSALSATRIRKSAMNYTCCLTFWREVCGDSAPDGIAYLCAFF